jgi:hypothetical protein
VHASDVADAVGHGAAVASALGAGAGAGKVALTGANVVATSKVKLASGKVTLATDAIGGNQGGKLTAVDASAVDANGKKIHPLAAIGWFAWIRLSMSVGFLVKTACMVMNIFYQASPLPLINEYNAKRNTGAADLAPFIAICYGGWQWCFYGLFAWIVTGKTGFLVLVYSNFVGATLGLYYVYSFTINCRNKAMLDKTTMYYYVLVSIVAVQFIAICSLQPVRALFFSGLISSAWSTVGSLSLMVCVPTVLEKKDSSLLPVPVLVMGLFSAVLWIVCGVMLWDPWITFPNTFGLVVCIFALYLCAIYPPQGGNREEVSCEKDDDDVIIHNSPDIERASPLQRALAFVRSNSHEGAALQDGNEATYGATHGPGSPMCGTGGTGDSF